MFLELYIFSLLKFRKIFVRNHGFLINPKLRNDLVKFAIVLNDRDYCNECEYSAVLYLSQPELDCISICNKYAV